MDAILRHEIDSPFFRRIEHDLQRSRELRASLQDLLHDVRQVNDWQPRTNDDLSHRAL